jgi:hypothetical protein
LALASADATFNVNLLGPNSDEIAAVTADDYVMIDFDGKVRNKAATLGR